MRRLLLSLALALPLIAAGCGDSTLTEPEISETTFAASLGVDLAAMTVSPTGLYSRDLVVGGGATAGQGTQVAVHYALHLPNGTLIEQSPAGDPLDFRLGVDNLIAGFTEGVKGMRVGGRRQIIVPPSLGYGRQSNGPIPPNSILVFTLELVSAT
jgi:FKBP-type peptidyl-prolyl cis-trans isomerase